MSDTERLAELNNLGSSHFWGNSTPLCPHCGAAFDIERNDAYDLYSDDDRHEVDCPQCDLRFSVRTHTSHSFSTDEQDE